MAINDLVVQAAVELGLEDGQKLRVDTTVVQTDIHHPTDSTLLWDVVRVVTRLVGRLAAALERRRIKGFRDRTRSARRRMQDKELAQQPLAGCLLAVRPGVQGLPEPEFLG